MSITYTFPNAGNVNLPVVQQALQSNFSQNPNKFPINSYVTYAPVDDIVFGALFIDPDEGMRLEGNNKWADGTKGDVNHVQSHSFPTYKCERYSYQFNIGDQAVRNAKKVWDTVATHAESAASRLMMTRSYNIAAVATTGANWGSNTATATSAGGGKWDVATTTNPYIQLGIQAAIRQILGATAGTVQLQDLYLVVGPNTAQKMAASDELRGFLKGSYDALSYLNNGQGFVPGFNLPNQMYGISKVIVDSTSYVSTARNAGTRTVSFVYDDVAMLVHRPGGVVGSFNSLSTLNLGIYDDMGVLIQHDDFNLLTEGRVYDTYQVVHQPISGYLFTDVHA